jgi:hypothetical protein
MELVMTCTAEESMLLVGVCDYLGVAKGIGAAAFEKKWFSQPWFREAYIDDIRFQVSIVRFMVSIIGTTYMDYSSRLYIGVYFHIAV